MENNEKNCLFCAHRFITARRGEKAVLNCGLDWHNNNPQPCERFEQMPEEDDDA